MDILLLSLLFITVTAALFNMAAFYTAITILGAYGCPEGSGILLFSTTDRLRGEGECCAGWQLRCDALCVSHVRVKGEIRMRALRVFGSFVYMTAVIFLPLHFRRPLCTFTINNVIVGVQYPSRVLDEVYRVWPEGDLWTDGGHREGITDSAALQKADRRSPWMPWLKRR